jgi:6,7-dimethyl-8-ribityllumazine synthase
MSEHTDEPHDWPLRDFSTRLRPPSPVEEPAEADEPAEAEPMEPEEEAAADAGEGGGVESEVAAGAPSPGAAPEQTVPAPEQTVPAPEQTVPAPEQTVPAPEQAAPAPDEHVEGELRIPDGYSVLKGAPDGNRRSVAVVVSRFNGEITNRLLDAALAELEEAGVARDAVLVMPVPGAFELPIAAMALAKTRRYACVIALGCVIRGETPHFDFVAGEAASGLQLAGIETGVPVAFGVLTCETAEQAEARVDRGAAAARSALEMADAFAQLRSTAVGRQ